MPSEFKKTVQRKIKERSSEEWSNKSTDHAIDVISSYLESVKKNDSVYIFANRLKGDVYGHPDVVKAARSAVKKGVMFHIAIQEHEVDAGGLLFYHTVINDEHPGNTFETAKGKDLSKNFMVAGEGMYRIEYEKSDRKARCSANCPDITSRLISVFNSL